MIGPEEVAEIIDRAERRAEREHSRLMRFDVLTRRRSLAEAVIHQLRASPWQR